MNNTAYLTSYVNQFVETVKKAGIKDVVICPGSRSTPLAYAFAKSEGIEFYKQIDERSAAFFALGIAKAKKSSCITLYVWNCSGKFLSCNCRSVLCTYSVIVITADRPHELREVGAPQAIDQIQSIWKTCKMDS